MAYHPQIHEFGKNDLVLREIEVIFTENLDLRIPAGESAHMWSAKEGFLGRFRAATRQKLTALRGRQAAVEQLCGSVPLCVQV